MDQGFQFRATPLPTSPTRGEVRVSVCVAIVPNSPAHTSPLVGEAGRGRAPHSGVETAHG